MIFVPLYEVHLADGTLIRSVRHFSSNRLQMDARHLHGHHRQPKHHSVIAPTYAAEQVYTYLSFHLILRFAFVNPTLQIVQWFLFDAMSSAALMRVQKLACLFKQLACVCSYISYFPLLLRKMKKHDVVRMAVFLPLSGWCHHHHHHHHHHPDVT